MVISGSIPAAAEPISSAIALVSTAGSIGAAAAGAGTVAAFAINTGIALSVSLGLSFRAAVLGFRTDP